MSSDLVYWTLHELVLNGSANATQQLAAPAFPAVSRPVQKKSLKHIASA